MAYTYYTEFQKKFELLSTIQHESYAPPPDTFSLEVNSMAAGTCLYLTLRLSQLSWLVQYWQYQSG